MKNARNKEVKHSNLFLAYERLTTDNDITIYWKKVKGHSRTLGQDKDGNDETDCLSRLGAESGTPWEFHEEWANPVENHAVCAVTRRWVKTNQGELKYSKEMLCLGRKPKDQDLCTMKDQDPILHAILELVSNGPPPGQRTLPAGKSKQLKAFRHSLPRLKIEKGLLVYSKDEHRPLRWVVPTNHGGSCLLMRMICL